MWALLWRLPLACAAASPVCAQTVATALPPVVISGAVTGRALSEAPYAVDVVDADTWRTAGPMINLSESLVRVPGVVVAHRSNYAQDLQISSRGFGARAGFGVRGLRLYTDGIPATMPDGQGQVTHFDLAGASRIEVLRGPYSVLYGNSSGGVIALFSQPAAERRAGVDADMGRFGLRQGRARIEAPLAGGFDLRASVSHLELDGLRPHGAARRNLANLRMGYADDTDRIVLLASDVVQNADDPLGLTRAQFDTDPGQTAPQATLFDTRKTARQTQLGARWQHRHAHVGPLSESALMLYRGWRGVGQWQAIPVMTQASPRHGGGVVDFDRDYGGADARAVWAWRDVNLVTGAAFESQRDDRRGFENFVGVAPDPLLGVTGALRRDEGNRAVTRDAYVQGEWQINEVLNTTAGVRRGRVTFSAGDRYLANGDDSGQLAFRYTNPVLGLRWKAAPGLMLHASVARGFESPTLAELAYRPDAQAGFNEALQPQTSRQTELGVRWSRPGVDLNASVFRIATRNEIGVQTNSGGRATFNNVGATRRNGAEASLNWRMRSTLRWQLAMTWLDAVYRDGFLTCTAAPCTAPSVPVPAGNRIAGTFRGSVFSELVWAPFAQQSTEVALEWRAQGRTAVNDLNSDAASGFAEAAFRLSHEWTFDARKLELLARIDNVANRPHVGSVIVNDGNGRYFEPAPGRSGWLGLRLSSSW